MAPTTIQRIIHFIFPCRCKHRWSRVKIFSRFLPLIIGADWQRKTLLESMKKHEFTLELTGPQETAMGHKIAFRDDIGYVFVKTK